MSDTVSRKALIEWGNNRNWQTWQDGKAFEDFISSLPSSESEGEAAKLREDNARLRRERNFLVSDEYQGIVNRAMDQWGQDVTTLRSENERLQGEAAKLRAEKEELREHIKGIQRIIISARDYKEWEKVRSVLVSAEWACSEALSTSETAPDAIDHFVDVMEKRNWGTSETAKCTTCLGEGGITAENFGDVFSFECPTCKGKGASETAVQPIAEAKLAAAMKWLEDIRKVGSATSMLATAAILEIQAIDDQYPLGIKDGRETDHG